jgi:hypothetical protein
MQKKDPHHDKGTMDNQQSSHVGCRIINSSGVSRGARTMKNFVRLGSFGLPGWLLPLFCFNVFLSWVNNMTPKLDFLWTLLLTEIDDQMFLS